MPWHGDLRAETGKLRHREDLRINVMSILINPQ